MQHFFEAVSAWFASTGINPVLAAFVAGILVALAVLRGRREGLPTRVTLSLAPLPPSDDLGSAVGARTAHTVSEASITIGDRTVTLPPDKAAELTRLVHDKSKIEAIRVLREATGLQLVDAKRLVETLERSSALQ